VRSAAGVIECSCGLTVTAHALRRGGPYACRARRRRGLRQSVVLAV